MCAQKAADLFLLTGFLGSGKTTLLKKILAESNHTQRIGVIQNEFAPTNVDGAELRSSGKKFHLLEINNGSVFCVCLLSGFIQSLTDFLDQYQPQTVFLEVSGLADPIAIAQLIQAPSIAQRIRLAQIWCVVDSSTFPRLADQVARVKHQTRVADMVLINKTDLPESDISRTKQLVSELNPFAEIRETTFCNTKFDFFNAKISQPVAILRAEEHAQITPSGRPTDINSAIVRTTKPISKKALETFLRRCESRVIRLKGFVNLDDGTTVAVQSCFGKTQIQAVQKTYAPSELIALGQISNEALNKDFLYYAKVNQ